MPDNKTDWTPDEAFWNEAWADMEDRLGRKRRRRLVLFPWLLGLALLLGGGALVLRNWNGPDPSSQATGQLPLPSDPAPATEHPPVAAKAPASYSGEASAETVRRRPDPVTRNDYPRESPVRPSASTAPERLTGKAVRESLLPPDAPTAPAPRSPESFASEATPTVSVALVPLADFELGSPAPELPDINLANEKAPPLTPAQPGGRYALAVGTTGYVGSFLPGGYLQFGRRFGKGAWFFPVAMRYDYGRRTLSVGEDRDLAEALNLVTADVDPQLSWALQSSLGENNRNVVVTHSVELRGGIGRRFGSRFTLSAGGAIAYLLGGNGPRITNLGNGNYYALRVDAARFGFSNFSSASPTYGNTAGGSTLSDDINKLSANAWLSVDYHLVSKFSLRLGFTQQLTPLYATDALRLEASRLDVGALYRF
ncbi:hypothetical protein CLV84_3009 [Neolewinella xylanilytica]|uniref:Uncharacterized protein n=1 Tax=Neolewinella xylanilytica TaxID=1514080 RepID=A0A2S6I4L6_9BACT|nr:hypothetical protein [Neolewinella xylanilytica]PPK86092.1 hypothetical protein CLV84_3009 [Neolewinella xylanilytica]